MALRSPNNYVCFVVVVVVVFCREMPEKIVMSTPLQRGDGNDGVPNDYVQLQTSQRVRMNIRNISQLLNTGLSAETLNICVQLCEAGVHPQALAEVVQAIVQEVEALDRETF